MEDYIDIKIDVFEHSGQRARVRRALTVNELIQEILKEFDDLARESLDSYALYLKGNNRPLAADNNLIQLDIQPQDELVFTYTQRMARQMLDPRNYASLRDDATGRIYDITWQPALIGRPSTDVDHNMMLAANLQVLPNGITVSRKHAQITFSDGRYYIELLAENNPVYLNGKEIPAGSPRELKPGDKLLIGRNRIPLTFNVQQPVQAAPHRPEPASRPVPQQAPPVVPQPIPTPVVQKPTPQPAPAPIDGATQIASGDAMPSRVIFEVCTAVDKIGQSVEITQYPFILGRTVLGLGPEAGVSRNHAEVNYDQRMMKFFITDTNSTNGVMIDGIPITPGQPHEVKPGSKIGLGQLVVVRFEV